MRQSMLRNERPPPAVSETLNTVDTPAGQLKSSPLRNASDCHIEMPAIQDEGDGSDAHRLRSTDLDDSLDRPCRVILVPIPFVFRLS